MRTTQIELMKVMASSVEMHTTEAGFFHWLITVGAIITALARLKGKAHWKQVAAFAGASLNMSAEAMTEMCGDGDSRTKWERECSWRYSDILVKAGICLPYETTGRGIWQFAPNIAHEFPDYSQLK